MSTICQDLNILGGGMFYNNWEYCGVVSNCEELVGVTHRRLGVQLHGAYLSGIEATKAINRVIG